VAAAAACGHEGLEREAVRVHLLQAVVHLGNMKVEMSGRP
jgi:hypothetical protein